MGERVEDGFLCAKDELPAVLAKAETDKERILKETKAFYAGDIDVRFIEKKHISGWSVSAILTVNGEAVREYMSPELCFLELECLILGRLLEMKSK